MSWEGICLDDGSGRNIVYVDKDGKRSRILPENFVPEYFEDGSRRYYYKGQCIRCREDSPAIFFSADNGEMAFALNYCEKCTIATTPGITNIRGNGRKIYDAHMDTPKHLYLRLRPPIVDPQRNAIHLIRGKIAQHAVKVAMKLRRNMERYRKVRIRAAQQDVGIGKYLSWGFGDSFDEYFGEVDSSDRPHGWGIKFYSDGSTYLGEWKDGQRHTVERKGIWSRPDGTTYEGTWQSDYKHGYGSMRYPDGANYDGEFAKGYEHGHGIKYGTDGNRFEGRFRFGKIDGPGCIFYHDGKTEKRVFREPDSFTEKPLPITQDDILDLHDPDEGRHHNTEEDSIMGNGPSGEDGKESGKKPPKFFQPDTLVTIAVTAVARTMFQYRSKLPSEKIRDRLQVFLKPRVARRMLQVMYPRGSIPFMNAAPAYAFVDGDTVALKHIPFRSLDTESLLYFIASNQQLRCLEMVNNRLDPTSLELVFKAIASGIWPNLEVIDLSFNKLDISILAALLAVIRTLPRIKALRLSGCKIAANGAALLARYIEETTTLEELNLSFNFVQAAGIEPLSDALAKNGSLRVLNLRQNNIGMLGGELLVDALRHNHFIRELCVADNKIGPEHATAIASRLKGGPRAIGRSFLIDQLNIPAIHLEKQVPVHR